MTTVNNLLIVLISISIIGCETKKVKTDNVSANKVDTLYYHENIFKDKMGFGIPHKTFKYKSKTKDGLPKNEEIIMTLSYEGDYKNLIKHTTTNIYPETDKLKITKIDDYNYKLFIDSGYSERIISMSYYLTPKKNYVMKVYYQDEVVRYPNKTSRTQFNQIVEQN